MFQSQLGVIEQSVRDCAIRSHLPLVTDRWLWGALWSLALWLRSSGLWDVSF